MLAFPSDSVKEVGGNIFLIRGGRPTQITYSGHDSEPTISKDGKRILFVRTSARNEDELTTASVSDAKLVDEFKINLSALQNSQDLGDIIDPQLSPDGSYAYFYTEPGNFGIIVRIALPSQDIDIIAHTVIPMERGKAFEVIDHGQYLGDIIVRKDHAGATVGRHFAYVLVNRNGSDLKVIGESEVDLERFRNQTRK